MRLKVLHVVPVLDPAAGGPSRSVLGLARAQAANGASVSLVTGGTATPSAGEMSGPGAGAGGASNGLLIRQGPILLQRYAIPAPRLMRILHRSIRTADIVHLHSLWNGVITGAVWLARRQRKPMVLSPHGMLDARNIKRRGGFKRWYLRLVDGRNLEALAAYHFLDETERVGCAWLPSARHKPYVIQPNGLDIDNLNRRLQSAPLAWAPFAVSGSKERKLVFLGRLNVIKGLELQLETLANLRTAGEAVSLHWIGPDDGEWPKLKALASRLGVADALHWHGPVYGDERLALLRAADAVLLTSHYECNSHMAAETMSVGGALVATDTCHLDRAALAGAARVAPREPGQFSAALLDVLRDETAAAALRDAGIEFARTALNGDSLAAKMLAFYRDLLDESRTCAA